MNNSLNAIGRVIYALPLIGFGLGHLLNAGTMKSMVPSYFPGGTIWIYLTGLALIATAISIIIQRQTKLACFLLSLMLFVFIITIHLPAIASADPMMQQIGMTSLFKDAGLIGGALVIASKY